MKAALKGIRAEYRRVYQAQRLQLRITIPPKERLLFEACREYAYSKNWIHENSNRSFLRFCVEVVLQNIISQMRREDEALLRRGGVSLFI